MARDTATCPLCGAALDAENGYCPSCGASIRVSDQESRNGGVCVRRSSVEVRRDGPLPDELRDLLHASGRGGSGVTIRLKGGTGGPSQILVREADGTEREYGSPDELPPNLRALFDRMQQMGMGQNLVSHVGSAGAASGPSGVYVRMGSGPAVRIRWGMLLLGIVVPLMLIGYGIHVSSTGRVYMPHVRRLHGLSTTVGGAAAQANALMAIGGALWFHFGLFWRALPFEWTRKIGRYGERLGIVVVLVALAAFFVALVV